MMIISVVSPRPVLIQLREKGYYMSAVFDNYLSN